MPKRSMIVLSMVLGIGSTFATEGSKVPTSLVATEYGDNSTSPRSSSLYLSMGSGAWSNAPAGCSETRAYIPATDKALQAAFLTFWTMGKTITLTVDNALLPVKDGGCQVVSVRAD